MKVTQKSYNKFLTLRFRCKWGKVLRFLRKNVFFCFWLEVFMHNNNGDKEKEWWRCGGVYGFYVFVSFSFIWDEWVVMDIIGHWLNVRQGNYQTMGSWWNSRCGAKKKRTWRQISKRWGLILLGMERRKKRGKRLDFWAIIKVLGNLLRNVFQ